MLINSSNPKTYLNHSCLPSFQLDSSDSDSSSESSDSNNLSLEEVANLPASLEEVANLTAHQTAYFTGERNATVSSNVLFIRNFFYFF